MALLDTLRDRAARKGGTTQVDCGGLGLLTVEALPTAECVRLSANSRALLYAACRELQSSGEILRKEGKVFRPDEILAYITDEEAEVAARTILSLSGVSSDMAAARVSAEDSSEIQHGSVQADTASSREAKNRHDAVQGESGDVPSLGQAAQETAPKNAESSPSPSAAKKKQTDDLSEKAAQPAGNASDRAFPTDSGWTPLEIPAVFRSEMRKVQPELLPGRSHSLHETAQDFGGTNQKNFHETTAESRESLHESKSENSGNLRESAWGAEKRQHETASELAEQAAALLVEELRRAAMVR